MPELAEVKPQKKAGYMDGTARQKRREEQLKKEEEELQQLMEQQAKGEQPEEEQEEKEEVKEASEEKKEAKEPESKEEDKELSAEEKTFKKRYGDLRRHMAEKEKEWEEKLKKMEERMGNSTDIVPPKSDEDIREWQKKYPDVAGIVQTVAERIADEKFKGAEDRLKELDAMAYETQRKSAEQKIREAHSDFDKLRDSDEFHDWAEKQPKWVQDALYENEDDPASVIRVIDLYKVDNNMTPSAKKKKEKEAASSVKAKSTPSIDADESGKKFRESEVQKMSDKEFEAKMDDINEAMRSGNFIYDISGGAR